MEENREILLKTRKLKKYFKINKKTSLKAVEDVTLNIYQGEKFGVVGESGCGKSTLGRVILQLYPQTSGSCVYHGKSIQEINPKYIQKEIDHLKAYQTKASEYYQESLKYDKKVEELLQARSVYDSDGDAKDAKKYDKISMEIAKYEFKSKELKKNASRQLREGSRTVGSLILCENIDEIASLFSKAEQQIHLAHECINKINALQDKMDENYLHMHQLETIDDDIKKLISKDNLSEEEHFQLEDLRSIQKKIKNLKMDDLIKENDQINPQLSKLKQELEGYRMQEAAYRAQAFTYRGKNILPITERTLDKAYQDKLDENYETGINLNKLTKKEMRSIRSDMQMIFQDPSASLDPRQSIGHAIEEVFAINTKMPKKVRKEKAMQLLTKVGLKREHYYSYPHALSGGQKQRVGIARAIALDPSFVILDEAVSALDVSVQAQILQLLDELIAEKKLTYFFITHDLGVVKHFCDRVMVMYLGNVCELADSKELFAKRLHPYTESLLDSVPRLTLQKDRKEVKVLEGEVPSAICPPSGCPFHTRCPKAMDICAKEKPKFKEAYPKHFVACHLYDK